MFGKKQKYKSLFFYDMDLSISLCHKQLCLMMLGRTMVSPAFTLSDYIKASKGEKQRIPLHFSTCIVKGVSFFLLIVLSSMVSGTEKLIILLEIKEKNNTKYTTSYVHTKYRYSFCRYAVGQVKDLVSYWTNIDSQPLFLRVHTQTHTQYSSNSFGSHADCSIGLRPRMPQGEVVREVYSAETPVKAFLCTLSCAAPCEPPKVLG